MKKITQAVLPAAGLGTRFLPVTKSMPKEMLPLVDTPAIHYVVKEALDAGIDDIIIITGRGKRAIEDYFDESPELEMHLRKKHDTEKLAILEKISTMVNIHYIRQKEPKGLPHAILQAEKHIGDQPFAVLLGDDIIKADTPCIGQLLSVYNKYQTSVLAVQKVPRTKIHRYGCIDGTPIKTDSPTKLYKLNNIIEKPTPEKAPSNYAAIGRYVFTPEMFESIKKTKPTIKNETVIADSICHLMEQQQVLASEFKGIRYDIGDKAGYIQAIIDYALDTPDIAKELKKYISTL